jgi:ABC-type arginine transport system permease subunit
VHGTVVTGGGVGELRGEVLHYTVRDLSDSVAKMNSYSTLGAAEVVKRGKRRSAAVLVLTAPVQFLRHYLLYQSFRNGIPGLAWSFMNAVGSTMKYLKARELEAGAAPPPPVAPGGPPA